MKTKKRQIETFEPCGPIRTMVRMWLKGKGRGAKKRLYQDAIASHIGEHYSKWRSRYEALKEQHTD